MVLVRSDANLDRWRKRMAWPFVSGAFRPTVECAIIEFDAGAERA
jgi:hypothetical protein